MTNILLGLLLTPALVIGWFRIVCLIRTVSQTALTAAAWWAVFAQAVLTLATACSLFPLSISTGTKDQLWHFSAVTALCPLIAVLGARYGRLRDWSLFIILPLIIVLEWPAVAQWSSTWRGQHLHLEIPSLIGIGVVALMGAGNFIETRFAWSMFWFVASWMMVLNLGKSDDLGLHGFALKQLCLWVSMEFGIRRTTTETGWHRVWSDYRDHFGSVWASRLMVRINEVADRDKWPWRFSAEGFHVVLIQSDSPNKAALVAQPELDPRVEQTFRWLLKPFVEPAWIDARLKRKTLEVCAEPQHPRLSAGDVTSSPPQSGDHDALH